jgi:hypothetical protein
VATDEVVGLLASLAMRPDDVETRRRAAEMLEQSGQIEQALGLLAPFVNFTGHEEGGPLPCLCKRCVAQAPLRAETDGVPFQRAFAISGTRVLHYWLADELAGDRAEVRRSVGEALRQRLKRKRKKAAS